MRIIPALVPSTTEHAIHLGRKAVTLLLVDDDEMVREALRAVLVLEGYTVVTASDGPKALEVASRTRFDMLVTDFHMPGMNGFALAKRLTERKPILPVLLVSAAPTSELPMDELDGLNWHFLRKPLDNGRMLKIIDRECLGWALRDVAARPYKTQP